MASYCTVCAAPAGQCCARCKTPYCGAVHQAAHWPVHKGVCKELAAMPVHACGNPACGAPCASGQKCGGCATVRYCSTACVAAHWVAHEAVCVEAVRERVRANAGELQNASCVLEARFADLRSSKGDDHPDTIEAISDLSMLLRRQGRYGAAEPLYRECLERTRRVLGPEHPDSLAALGNLGALLQCKGRLPEAELLLREALESARRVLGPSHKGTLTSSLNYAQLLLAQSKPADAENELRNSVLIARATLAPRDITLLKLLGALAESLRQQQQFVSALPLALEVHSGCRCTMGADHPDSLAALGGYARILLVFRRFAQAEALYREAVATCRRVLPGHPDTALMIKSLALLLYQLGGIGQEEEALLREALAGLLEALGEQHPSTQQCRAVLEALLREQARVAVRAGQRLYAAAA